MSLLFVPIIATLALFLVLLMSIIFFVYLKKNKEKMSSMSAQVQDIFFLMNELQQVNNTTKQQLGDMKEASEHATRASTQVCQQLEQRITKMKNQLIAQEQRLAQWQDKQGQDKFYNRAFKLAEKGADIDEIISECELPRAEVEMLLSVYQQRTRSQE